MKTNEILNAYHFRHACKEFDSDKKINDEDFSFILETGRLSPSSFGFEPWKFLVVQNMKLREKLKTVTWGAQGTLPSASHFVIILARKQKSMRYDSEYIDHMMRDIHHLPQEAIEGRGAMYQTFQENDFHLLGNERASFDWACKQTYIALGNMMTSAAMINIDSCPVEGFKFDELAKIMSEDFNVDTSEFSVACMVAFGYRINQPAEKTRQAIEDISAWYN